MGRINFPEIEDNVDKEVSNSEFDISNRILVKNADRLMLVSGYKNFFYEQKQFYLNEVQRLSSQNTKLSLKKKNLKEELIKKTMDGDVKINQLLLENTSLKTKVYVEKSNAGSQTTIELRKMNEMAKIYDDVKYLKFIVSF